MGGRYNRRLAALGAGLVFAASAHCAHAGRLLAGAAKVPITPPAAEFPFEAGKEKPFVGVHDDVFVRALAMDDSAGQRGLVVSVEVTAIPEPAAFVAVLAQATGLSASSIMVLATHTHSVPLTFFHGARPNAAERREIDRIRNAAVQAARQALGQMQPAKVSFARGQAYVNTNNGEQAGRKYWYDPAGSSDKTLDLLDVTSMAGKPLALLVNYANHGEVMFRSVTRQGGYEVTGDLPGAVSRLLETRPDGAPVVLFAGGAEGDQLPLFKSRQPDTDLPGSDQGAGGWSLLDVQARRLAGAVVRTLATAPAGVPDANLSSAAAAVSCPGQHYRFDPVTHRAQGIESAPPVAIPLAVLRINGIVLAGIGADIASDIGVAIKRSSPVANTVLLTMLAGSVGYVLNDAAYEHPTHGVMGSPVKPGCATSALSDGLQRLLVPLSPPSSMANACCARDAIPPGAPDCTGERIYIGTHAQDGQPSLFTSSFDESTGVPGAARAVSAVSRPTWLVKDPARPVLYSVSETGNDGKSVGNVFSLRIDAGTGRLEEIGQVPSGGGGPTHLALDARSNTLFVANFGTGHAAALPIGDKGELGAPASIGADHGTVPTRRQQGPHAHGVTVDPSRQFLLVPDLGADRIFIYRLTGNGRRLAPAATPFLQLPPGSGPRHLAFSPDGRMAYLLTELTAELRVYAWDAQDGVLRPVQTLSTAGADYQGQKSAGEIVVAGDGRTVYVSSRGEDAIVAYAVDARSGQLSEMQRTPSGGRQPWHLVLSPGGRWLLASNEASDSVNVFGVDASSGRLAATPNALQVTKPVDVVFAGACARR